MAPTPPPELLSSLTTGQGERLALVHGFTQSAASWATVRHHLEADFEVTAVDLPGHGGSGRLRPSDMRATAELLAATVGAATYVGYSLGARVSLSLALAHPELVERLVLVSGSPGIASSDERAARVASDAALADRLEHGLSLEDFLDEWLSGPLFSHLSDDQADRPSRRSNTPEGLAASLRSAGTGSQPPWHDRLGELEAPVLLVAGALDQRYVAIASEMADAIGERATLEIVPDAGHAAPYEQPEAFCRLFREFVSASAPHRAMPSANSAPKTS